MKKTHKQQAFTLIELLTVIAIIGILAAILIPAVNAVRTNANISASKASLSQYVNAIQAFKSEYGYLPFSDKVDGEGHLELDNSSNSRTFIETLSARDTSSFDSVSEGGNRRRIQFYEFSDNELYVNSSDKVDHDQLADRFNNTNIVIVLDTDGDGEVTVPDPDGSGTMDLRATVTAYVEADEDIDAPAYYLYK